jgi:hypothetical protein
MTVKSYKHLSAALDAYNKQSKSIDKWVVYDSGVWADTYAGKRRHIRYVVRGIRLLSCDYDGGVDMDSVIQLRPLPPERRGKSLGPVDQLVTLVKLAQSAGPYLVIRRPGGAALIDNRAQTLLSRGAQ